MVHGNWSGKAKLFALLYIVCFYWHQYFWGIVSCQFFLAFLVLVFYYYFSSSFSSANDTNIFIYSFAKNEVRPLRPKPRTANTNVKFCQSPGASPNLASKWRQIWRSAYMYLPAYLPTYFSTHTSTPTSYLRRRLDMYLPTAGFWRLYWHRYRLLIDTKSASDRYPTQHQITAQIDTKSTGHRDQTADQLHQIDAKSADNCTKSTPSRQLIASNRRPNLHQIDAKIYAKSTSNKHLISM